MLQGVESHNKVGSCPTKNLVHVHVENVVSVYTCSQTSLNACTCTNIMCKCCTKQADRASSFLSMHVCGCFIGCWVVGGLHDRCMVSAYVQAHSQK